ncbi:cytochrome c oxidase assembly protein [Bacillus infantis]|uniref:cytochrome c oxidase assembly protein n=1 Tax=Bacillus infantis TaxID=324767 RepID=UPI00200530B9|nr:cytochrome c oxidase assembly protein [Bacillus infantis]
MHGNSHQHHETVGGAGLVAAQSALIMFFVCLLLMYLAVQFFGKRDWPFYRTVLWAAGILCCMAAAGPIASWSHNHFSMHMMGHLLLGMLGPLLMVLSAPVTLFLRMLPAGHARKGARLLKSRFFGFVSHPAIAAILNIGGLWLLYTTDLFTRMHQQPLLYLLVHLHVFLAGYLFTASFVSIEPTPHRKNFMPRAAILITALAGHGILSKYLYAHPPAGVSIDQAQSGAVLMYYGGDLIDVFIIIFFCLEWYKARRPRKAGIGTAPS